MDSQDVDLLHRLKKKNGQAQNIQEQTVQRERAIIQEAQTAFRDNRRWQGNMAQRVNRVFGAVNPGCNGERPESDNRGMSQTSTSREHLYRPEGCPSPPVRIGHPQSGVPPGCSQVIPNLPVSTVMNVSIGDPPKYQDDRYELFRRALVWWGDIHLGVSDRQLIGTMALRSEGLIKGMMVQFMGGTRRNVHNRTMPALLETLGRELSKTSQETASSNIGVWSSFPRKPSESVRMFLGPLGETEKLVDQIHHRVSRISIVSKGTGMVTFAST